VICRRILIRSDQTLQELHRAIFVAFDREEEHMYEFQVGGKGPRDSKAGRFDFGDDWWHQINVAGIDDRVRPGKYPKVTKRVGASPPQYANLNAEDER
jgi:hypothetical protein